MNRDLANNYLKTIRQRISEGDCPSTKPLATEALEELVVHFADHASPAADMSPDLDDLVRELRDEATYDPVKRRAADTIQRLHWDLRTSRDRQRIRDVLASAEPVTLDWVHLAKMAGTYGIRYATNQRLGDFLAAIRSALHPTPPPVSAPVGESDGIAAIAAERQRQIEAEGWTPEHDDQHTEGVMAIAAACYALNATDNPDGPEVRFVGAELWPWADEWWKPSSPRRDLVKAGALIAAEIDRLDRAALRSPAVEGK